MGKGRGEKIWEEERNEERKEESEEEREDEKKSGDSTELGGGAWALGTLRGMEPRGSDGGWGSVVQEDTFTDRMHRDVQTGGGSLGHHPLRECCPT